MKTNDPLDHKIDELLASQPVKASPDFAARTLAEAEAQPQAKKPGPLAPLLRFALPLAAAAALAFVVYSLFPGGRSEAPAPLATQSDHTEPEATLNNYEIQELLMLQEGLAGFARIESGELDSAELLDTLDTLYSI